MNTKMLIPLLIIFQLTFFTVLQAQDTWIKTYDPFWPDVNYYFPEDIVVCQDGGYAVNGYYYFNDPELMIEEQWGFLMKTDCDGNLQWAKLDTLDFMTWNRSYAFVETIEGDFISIGYSYGGGYMIKRDYEGNLIWAIPYNDFGANSMDITDDGNIILGGVVEDKIALRKIDQDGNTIWTNSHDCGNVAIANSIIQTNDGGYALTGYTGGNGYDIIVMKADVNGDSLWTKTYDGYGYFDRGKSISEDSCGNIIMAGELDEFNFTIGFLWLLNENGNTIWTQEVDSSTGHSHTSILALPDNSFTAYTYSGSGGNREMTIYNFDNNYNITWISELNSNIAEGDKCISFLESNQYICVLSNVGGIFENNIGIAKTDSQGQVVSVQEFELPNHEISLSNFPNPFNPETKINFDLPVNIENPTIEIFNIKGEKIRILKPHFTSGHSQNSVLWDGKNQYRKYVSSGVYFYRVKADDFESNIKKMTLLK